MSALPPNAVDLDNVTAVRVGTTQIAEIRAGAIKIWPGGPQNYREAILADNPVAYYRLGEPSGNALDEMGGPQGVLSGSPTRAQASLLPNGQGASILLAGTSTQIAIPASAATNIGGGEWTIEAWIREALNSNVFRTIMAAVTPSAFAVMIHTADGVSANQPADRIRVSAGGSQFSPDMTPSPTLARNTVHYLVVTRSSSGVNVYRNARLIASRGAGGGTTNNSAGFNIAHTSPMPGHAQEYALYGYALSLSQIETHFRFAGGQP